MMRLLILLFVYSFTSVCVAQAHLVLKINTEKPVFLSYMGVSAFSLHRMMAFESGSSEYNPFSTSIENDTTIYFFEQKTPDLVCLHVDSKKYYLLVDINFDLEVDVQDNSISLIEYSFDDKTNEEYPTNKNSFFMDFLSDYFELYESTFEKQLNDICKIQNIDQFEISLYNFINDTIFHFYQNHEHFNKFTDANKNIFEMMVRYKYLSVLSNFMLDSVLIDLADDDLSRLSPISSDVGIGFLNWDNFQESFNNDFAPLARVYHHHNDSVNDVRNYMYNGLLLFALDRYGEELKTSSQFQDFTIFFINFMKDNMPFYHFLTCIHDYIHQFSHSFSKNSIIFLLNTINNYTDPNSTGLVTDYWPDVYAGAIVIDDLNVMLNDLYNDVSVSHIWKDKIEHEIVKNDFYMLDLNNRQVSLSDFHGKILYIDIWASWCGPCRKQFPYSKELKNKLSKKQLKKIEFIYISIDNSEIKWRESIDNLKLEGKHFISPADTNDGAGTYFQVSSIPRYILIDENGDIINSNAKRPSDETLLNDLLQLIKR